MYRPAMCASPRLGVGRGGVLLGVSPPAAAGQARVGFLNGEGGKVKMLEEEELHTGTQESLGKNPRVGVLLGGPEGSPTQDRSDV